MIPLDLLIECRVVNTKVRGADDGLVAIVTDSGRIGCAEVFRRDGRLFARPAGLLSRDDEAAARAAHGALCETYPDRSAQVLRRERSA